MRAGLLAITTVLLAVSHASASNVLVWQDAPLYSEPSDQAAALKLAALDGARTDHPGSVIAMRVVATVGDYLQVAPLAGECTSAHLVVPDDISKLTLYVKRVDVAPVLAKPFQAAFADGTRIELSPGMPVVAGADGKSFAISLRGDTFVVDLPSASVATSYTPARAKPITMTAGGSLAIARGTKARLGDRTFTLGAWEGAPVAKSGGSATVALEDNCATVHVTVPTSALRDSDEDSFELGGIGSGSGSGSAGGALDLRGEYFIAAGTALAVGSRTVATAARPIYLPVAPSGKTACFERRFQLSAPASDTATDTRLRFCVPAASVVRERVRTARSAGGATGR